MAQDFLQSFALDSDQLQILMLMQQELVVDDIAHTAKADVADRKQVWLDEWQVVFAENLQGGDNTIDWFTRPTDYTDRITVLSQSENRLQAGILLLELITFAPYVALVPGKNPIVQTQEQLSKVRKTLFNNPLQNLSQKFKDTTGEVERIARDMPETIKTGTQRAMNSVQTTFRVENIPSWEDVKDQLRNPLDYFQNGMRHNEDVWVAHLKGIAVTLGFDSNDVDRLRRSIDRTHDALTHKWRNLGFFVAGGMIVGAVTLGAATPAIAGFVGTTAFGWSGAAALTSGMAAIGGLIGGGMAAGPVVLVGGGLLLGLAGGATAGQGYQFASAKQISVEAVKLEVVLKEIILQQQDTAVVLEILERQRTTIQAYQVEIDRLRVDTQDNQQRINELEKAVQILEKALKRNQELVKNA